MFPLPQFVRRPIAAAIALMLLVAAPVAAAPRIDDYPAFASTLIAPRHVTVRVPDGYDPAGPPLPVLYMQDGQNLYDPARAYAGKVWAVDVALDRLVREGKARPAIIVGIDNGPLRGREYLPAAIYDRLAPATRALIRTGWDGAPLSDAYLRFLVTELKPFVDRHYRTLTGPADTFVMGSSMGGLISLYAQLRYPHVFGGSASLSMHWLLGRPGSILPPQADLLPQEMRAWNAAFAASRLRPAGHRIYVDRGTATLDAGYGPYALAFDRLMRRRGWTGRSFVSRTFPGADHSEPAWADRVAIPLAYLLAPR